MDADPWADAPSTPSPSSLPALPNSPPDARTGTGSGVASKMGSPLRAQVPAFEDAAEGFGFDDDISGFDKQAQIPAEEEETGEKDKEPPAPAPVAQAEEDDGFDDFDDFNKSAPAPAVNGSSTPAGDDDEGFGDFGDFEEGDFEEAPQEQETGVVQEPEPMVERWRALELRPPPPKSEIADQLSVLFAPLIESGKDVLTDEPPRAVGGLGQVLVGESSRDAYAQLTTPPLTKPLDWTRSRVRRDHLISLGVPVNLDEVDSHRLSSLPPLRITTSFGTSTSGGRGGRPQPRRAETYDSYSKSTDGDGRYTAEQKGKGRDQGPFSAAPGDSAAGSGKYGIGLRPEMDTPKAEELCGLEEDNLSLLPLSTLKTLQQELVTTSAQASATLAWMLQLKDAQAQDSATYNGMISSLIANAARAKSAQQSSGGGVFRRSSTKVQSRPQSVSGSGGMTPRRVGSPGMW
ncbi:hypothetical protein IAR50_001788 [Cryptococcus sp. DSM 104548]